MSDSTESNQAQGAQEAAADSAPPQFVTVTAHDSRSKSPFLACLLSLMPGLGQVYVGYYQRGFIHMIVAATVITMLASGLRGLTPLAAIFLAFFWLYNVIDAGRRAVLYNQALAGGSDFELPADFETPGLGGSVVGGVVIALVGAVLLSRTAFDVDFDWLEEWWPVALIIFGGYLVWKAKRNGEPSGSDDYEEE